MSHPRDMFVTVVYEHPMQQVMPCVFSRASIAADDALNDCVKDMIKDYIWRDVRGVIRMELQDGVLHTLRRPL